MQLQSEDHGKDLQSVVNLLKRHSLLENDVHSHGEACQTLKDTALTFQNSDHFMKDEIQEKSQTVLKRYVIHFSILCMFMYTYVRYVQYVCNLISMFWLSIIEIFTDIILYKSQCKYEEIILKTL